MQRERLRDEIMEEIYTLDYFALQKLSAFMDNLERMKVQKKEGEGTDHEAG